MRHRIALIYLVVLAALLLVLLVPFADAGCRGGACGMQPPGFGPELPMFGPGYLYAPPAAPPVHYRTDAAGVSWYHPDLAWLETYIAGRNASLATAQQGGVRAGGTPTLPPAVARTPPPAREPAAAAGCACRCAGCSVAHPAGPTAPDRPEQHGWTPPAPPTTPERPYLTGEGPRR
jgi:hypothetical protein